ncbi:paraquat-inducible protein B [Cribrihabitans marinus]|uniref:Paraquat-inducible protein B n=1 Tax=Cribrihabitans marinus TaxID=1227549 RepID=A0A1H7DAB2_9RHOB|nr:MlaD family protein [Cribrihabitans marinus]GGH37243.1 paraquat-inducible protein B [Cribrihabitans marinus]SEJ95155.1 paraquat-inducible protein B [Cribrihabitans marinus]
MTDPTPADLDIAPPRRAFWRNLSFVWVVPVLALMVSLGLAWQTYADRGVLIEITFNSAQGVTPKETTLRYRDVSIGQVEDVTFSPDLSKVVVQARVDKNVAPFLDQEATFWIVSPQVSARGITGLSTVLSGVYIEGAWDQEVGVPATRFVGSDGPPLVQPGRPGKRITLLAEDGRLLSEGAPVYFHGVRIGRLEQPRLVVSSDAVVVDAFIEAPHDRRLNTATRFWDTSGFDVSFSSAGLSVEFESISALVAGGVKFDSVYEGGTPVKPGHVFTVYADEAEARRSLFAGTNEAAVEVGAAFGESVTGLEPGATVRLNGLNVGEVVAIQANIEETEFGPELRPLARLSILPESLGLPRGADRDDVLDFLEAAVAKGLRARLATTSLFSSALVVELVELPDADPATFQRDSEPLPLVPSVTSDLPDFTATAQGVLERINELPIEDLIEQATAVMASAEALLRRDSTVALPDNVSALLTDTRALINAPSTQALPGELRDTIAELRAVVTDLRQGGATERLISTLEQADRIAANLATASDGVPELIEELRAVAEKANALQAEELVTAARQLLESADAVVDSDATRALPASLNAALDEVRGALADLREGGAVENANATMASARDAADAVARASKSLPELSARLDRLIAQSEGLLATYGARSSFNDETLSALREIRDAARAVSQLARSIERNPNSLLIGR